MVCCPHPAECRKQSLLSSDPPRFRRLFSEISAPGQSRAQSYLEAKAAFSRVFVRRGARTGTALAGYQFHNRGRPSDMRLPGPIPVPPGIVDTIMEQEDDRGLILTGRKIPLKKAPKSS